LRPGQSTNLCAVFTPAETGSLAFAGSASGRVAPAVATRCDTRITGIPAVLIELVDLVDPIEIGTNETYEITVLNQGSAILTNVKLVCTLEAGQEFVSGAGASSVQADGRTVTLAALPQLQPKEKAVWQVVVKPLSAGDVRFTTDLTTDQFEKPIRETESTRQY
jgi:uncharacterized repeat protein (TIGR01451 family)